MNRSFAALFILCFCLCFSAIWAQQVPVGNWQTHFAYNQAYTVEKAGDRIFAGGQHLWSYSLSDYSFNAYTKVNGLSDVGIRLLRYDESSGFMIIVYENSNIDLWKSGSFYNIPDIRNANVTGSKRINSVYFSNQLMYLCTDFGIVVLNPAKREIKETYVLQNGTKVLSALDLCRYNGYFYAATSGGLYKVDENSQSLQNFANWSLVDGRPVNFCFTFNSQLYTATEDSLFDVQSGVFQFRYTGATVFQRIRSGLQSLYICESGGNRRSIMVFDQLGQLKDSIRNINPYDVAEINPGELWEADYWEGLVKITDLQNKEVLKPNAVFSNAAYNLRIYNNDLYVASGAELGWVSALNSDGISKLHDGVWTTYNRFLNTPGMDTVIDIVDVAVDKKNNYIYGASYGGGLIEIHPDNTSTVYKNDGYIQYQIGNPGVSLVMGLIFDDQNNLWISNYSAPDQLVVKKNDGTWQKFSFPYNVSEKSASQIVIDDAGQKWLLAPRGIGIYVLNDNGSIDNKNDDQIKLLRTGSGSGNLPNNEIYCLEKDKNGKIWVGTADGIGIFNCPESIFSQEGCDAELKIVKYDLNAGLLFQREAVRTIAVDGANNKWIGTNNGIWLISDDAEKIIHRFTKDNSPLPSNEINKIVVHPQTGDVYIATNAGLISYRGEATEGANTNDDLLIFPNPVASGYEGTISIKGLVENADVRITDVAGQLVYRTKAQGGQANWNGKNYTGQRPRTGVYYVFVTNSDGSEKKVGKFIYNE
ncbi:MAG: T9SS type A sorting domain-containing protein [Chitinophagaceae bacterium]|nr:T9SS type A sorting domain-containing protein [Chitinophagaceae bacterium]